MKVYADFMRVAWGDFVAKKHGYIPYKKILAILKRWREDGLVDGDVRYVVGVGQRIVILVDQDVLARVAEQYHRQSGTDVALVVGQLTPEITGVDVLFENERVLVLNKPAGMISQGPANGPMELWQLLRHHNPEWNIVHRIDMFTSGVILGGRSREARGYFQRHWHQITKKVYLAVIKDPGWEKKTARMPLKGKSAVTSFEVIEVANKFALVRCELVQNGRTHQIRKHLKMLGSPIVGDLKYGGPETQSRAGQLLHAWQMQVRLPDKNLQPSRWTKFQASIPNDFKSFGFDWNQWDAEARVSKRHLAVPSV